MKINKFGSITIKDGNLTIADFDFNGENEIFKDDGDQWNAAIEAIFDFIRDQFKGYFKPVSMVYFEHAVPASPSDSAIAPPVAAGSVDTPVFQELMRWFRTACFDPYSNVETKAVHQTRAAIVAHIDAWGEQQREAGKMEAIATLMPRINHHSERAEKAEAELATLKAKIGDLHCKSCGTHEISLTKECHNSDCAEYANAQEVYAGWKV